MTILFRAYFLQKNFQNGSGSGRFRKSDPDPVKNRPDPQHCALSSASSLSRIMAITKMNVADRQ
jgi:hypothetical protein